MLSFLVSKPLSLNEKCRPLEAIAEASTQRDYTNKKTELALNLNYPS